MPAYLILEDEDGTILHTETVGAHTHLIIEDHSRVATHFKHAGTTSAATTVIVQPASGEAVVVTDLVLSQEKVSSGALTVQYTDGTDTEILFKGSSVQAPIALAIPYEGRVRGWRDARVEMISAGTNVETDVSVHYYRLKGEGVLSFADWDAERG